MKTLVRVVTGIVIATLVSPTLLAQVFPDRPALDAVELSDGTVLHGVITEDVPERYVQIEIWGGSSFVVAYDRIASISVFDNPDYDTGWIKITLGEGADGESVAPQEEATGEDAPPRRRVPLSHRFGLDLHLTHSEYFGGDWGVPAEEYDSSIDVTATSGWDQVGFGASYLLLTDPPSQAGWRRKFGGRVGIEYTSRNGQFDFDYTDTETYAYSYVERRSIVQLPLELLIGYGGERFSLFAGGGAAFAARIVGPDGEVDQRDSGSPDIGSGVVDRPSDSALVTLSWVLSLTGLLDFGEHWFGHTRIVFDRLVVPWNNDRDVAYWNLSAFLGFGYRLTAP